ncbi:methyltransferase domain-containing protein [Nocardia crassostreae]|uniref:methyltransferase domain-containing protein n=1 Tax=Nocardia crassostreae TaxID=53428 RepID=UPI00082B0BA1|nr:methyltransferase domain-containing protein [Nocardia crassostreae]
MTDSNHMPSFRSDQIESAATGQLVDVLDMQASVPGIRRLREWAQQVLAVRAGERALDIGSGTGSEVFEFAHRVGADGMAVGVDANPAMLAVARSRAAEIGVGARFVEASAYRLPFADDSFDAVRCERVYQHLDDPAGATAEIARVLRPGGRVILIDTDWHTAITHPGDPEVVAALDTHASARATNPGSGRLLRGLLVRAGFVIDDLGSQAVIWDPEVILPLQRMFGESAVAAGVITAAQAEQLLVDIESGVRTGDFHMSVTMFAVPGHLAE